MCKFLNKYCREGPFCSAVTVSLLEDSKTHTGVLLSKSILLPSLAFERVLFLVSKGWASPEDRKEAFLQWYPEQ